jgi:hypothetical protein
MEDAGRRLELLLMAEKAFAKASHSHGGDLGNPPPAPPRSNPPPSTPPVPQAGSTRIPVTPPSAVTPPATPAPSLPSVPSATPKLQAKAPASATKPVSGKSGFKLLSLFKPKSPSGPSTGKA